MLTGHCLCKSVELRLARHADGVSACHCAMCRRWSGAAMFGLVAQDEDVTITGPVCRYRSSSFAERAWCGTCGTHLWIRDDDATEYEFMPGLFDGAKDVPLVREVYSDRAFAYVPLAGTHDRVSAEDYEAGNPFVEGKP